MAAKIISGTEIAAQIREEIKQETAAFKEKTGVVPGLVTILVGQNPASISYVTAKGKTAKELGFYSIQDDQPENITEDVLLALIDKYNKDPKIHGILVQLPLPKHVNETKVLYAIDPNKDVDAFHPVNVGKLVIGEAAFYPCTPYGIQQLLIRSGAKTRREYHLGLSKQMMKLSKYSARGTTQSRGMTVTSWQSLLVVASSSTEAQAGRSTHSAR